MSIRNIHGTDCFEVEAFLNRNEVSKIFKVRHKTSGQFYSMEVAPRKKGSPGPINTSLQETQYYLSKFWINLKFTFQTSSKLYYVLQYIGETTLESLVVKNGQFTEDLVKFYASEMLIALEEIHSRGLFYGELGLDKVCVDDTGHVVLWRSFCGKKYWTRSECVCNMVGFTRGNLCENTHGKSSDREVKMDYQLLGLVILQLFSKEHLTSSSNNKMSPQEGLSRLTSTSFTLPSSLSVFARDLVTRLLKGQFYNSAHIKSHPFFLGVNWKMVQARLTTPPTITRKASYPRSLRKTSSEASLTPQRPVRYNNPIPIPTPYGRPSTPLITSPVNYSPDNSMASSYPQNHPHNIAPPPRMLRSALSSPDLTGFGREVDHVTWSRDQPMDVPIQPVRHPDYHLSPDGMQAARYGLQSQSLSDLSSIDGGYDGYGMTYGRQRTSSLTDSMKTLMHHTGNHDGRISQHFSFPPSVPFERQRDDYVGYSNYGHSNYGGGYVQEHDYRPHSGHGYSRNINQHQNHFNDFSHAYTSPPYHVGSDGLSNELYHPRESPNGQFTGHVITNGVGHSRENLATLHRYRSCSDLEFSDDEQRRNVDPRATPTIDNMERRKQYPLAQIPIPSFQEYKRKNSRIPAEGAEEEEEIHLRDISNKKDVESKTRENMNRNVKTQHTTQSEEGGDYKTKLRSTEFLKSRRTPKKSQETKDINSTSSEPNNTTDKSNGCYSHNDVIHNLMLKYGLYERSEKRRENRNIVVKTPENHENSSKLGSPLESQRKRDLKENTERIEKQEDHESSVSTRRNGRASRSPRSERRRASAVVQQLQQAPTLTRKSKSTLGPGSLSEISEDVNNNTKTTNVKEEMSSPSSPSLGTKESRYKELTASKTDLLSISDVYKTPKQSVTSNSPDPATSESDAMDTEKSPQSLRKTSKTIWAAAKFKLKLRKSPVNSPLVKRKEKGQNDDDDNRNENALKMGRKNATADRSLSTGSSERGRSPPSIVKDNDDTPRRMSLEPPCPGLLQKGGLHTSLLSIASSLYSTDIELDDSISLHSDCNDTERSASASSRRRWESFHSSISADSGSAHMYEFENDSLVIEDTFSESEKESENRKKSDSEIERTDSGIGGDIGGGHKQSWEDIVLKSSKRWSIVAASAHHWQDLANKAKQTKEVAIRKKSSITSTITEDMVECLDCQKYFLPEAEKHDRITEPQPSRNTTTICTKCRERRVERKEAIIELVQTEINYANDLQILKEEFYSPLQSGGILQPDNLAEIFLNLQELVEVSTKFSSRLEKALEVSVSRGNEEFSQVNVGSIFLESVDFFQSYEIYCTKQNAASVLLDTLQKKNELLKIFLNVTCRENQKCRKMDLSSFLLAPVQRIMKYPLLLSRIRKATPRRNADREKLMQAQRKIEEQLNRINALNSTVETRQRRYRGSGHLGRSDSLDKLQMKKMASEILNWSMGEMHLLMYGVFEVVIHEFFSTGGWSRRGSKRTVDVFMLFCVRGLSEAKTIDSDEDDTVEEPLFPSEADATDAALVLLRKKMNGKYTLFKEPLSLHSCVICKDSEHKDCFEVINMSRDTYVFKATSTKESKKWLKHLRLQAKDLGAWKKRRNGLPNIMIKTI